MEEESFASLRRHGSFQEDQGFRDVGRQDYFDESRCARSAEQLGTDRFPGRALREVRGEDRPSLGQRLGHGVPIGLVVDPPERLARELRERVPTDRGVIAPLAPLENGTVGPDQGEGRRKEAREPGAILDGPTVHADLGQVGPGLDRRPDLLSAVRCGTSR